MSDDAIAHYHDLLSNSTLAADSQERLETLQAARGLYFGDRPLCNVLRPRFLTPGQYGFVRDKVKVLLPAFEIVRKLYTVGSVDVQLILQAG